MNVFVTRDDKEQPWGTPGRLVTADGFICDTLELPWRNNQRGLSCICEGTYLGWPWRSPTMKRTVIRLEDKNGRHDCLIHAGNFAGDVLLDEDGDGDTLQTQVHGCTLVGNGYAPLLNKNGDMQMAIMHSRDTLTALIEHLGAGSHTFFYLRGEHRAIQV